MARLRSSALVAHHGRLATAAGAARSLRGTPRTYALRHGVAHALAAGRTDNAAAWLTSFAWLQLRTTVLPAEDVPSLGTDVAAVARALDAAASGGGVAEGGGPPSAPPVSRHVFEVWVQFVREHLHLLRRGTSAWPPSRILLQLAVEHADSSPVTQAAEAWLAGGGCDWVWLRRAVGKRPSRVSTTSLVTVLEGHDAWVTGAVGLGDGRVASWSVDGTIRVWDLQRGVTICVLDACDAGDAGVHGVIVVNADTLVSWSGGNALRGWDVPAGALRWSLDVHTAPVVGAILLVERLLLSWSADASLALWDLSSGTEIVSFLGHEAPVSGAVLLTDGRLASWSTDGTVRIWDVGTGEPLAVLDIEADFVASGRVIGVAERANGRLYVETEDATHVYDGTTFAYLHDVSVGEERQFALRPGAQIEAHFVLPSGRSAFALEDGEVAVCDETWSACLFELLGHSSPIYGVCELDDGRLLTWSSDRTLRLWNGTDGTPLAVIEGHAGSVVGCVVTGTLAVSWSRDRTLRVWNLDTHGDLPTETRLTAVKGSIVAENGAIVAWSNEGVWSVRASDGSRQRFLREHGPSDRARRSVGPDGRLHEIAGSAWPSRLEQVASLGNTSIVSWSFDEVAVADIDGGARWALRLDRGFWGCVPFGQDAVAVGNLSDDQKSSIEVYDGSTGRLRATFEMPSTSGSQVTWVEGRSMLRWDNDGTLLCVDGTCEPPEVSVLSLPAGTGRGARVLPGHRLLLWGDSVALGVYDSRTGAPVVVFAATGADVIGARFHAPESPVRSAGTVLSWHVQGDVCAWEVDNGALRVAYAGGPLPGDDGSPAARTCLRSWRYEHRDSYPSAFRSLLDAAPRGATVLPGGDLLTWTADGTLRRVDGCTGELLARVPSVVASYAQPSLLRAFRTCEAPSTVRPGGFAVGGHGGVVHYLGHDDHLVATSWHADGTWVVDHLLADGTIVARCNDHLAVLQIHGGAHRIDVLEAADRFSRPMHVG